MAQTFDSDDYVNYFNYYAQRQDGKVPDYFQYDFGKVLATHAGRVADVCSPT